MARTSRELTTRPAVDPEEEPSHAWGWHAGFPKGTAIGGWFTVVALLLMIIGNHEGNTENLWLIGVAAVLAFGLVLQAVHRRNSWRR